MTKRISLVVTYDPTSEKFSVDANATALLFPDGVYFDDDTQYWSDQPLAIEDVMDRLTVRLSASPESAALQGEESVPISTKFIELALNILDPDFTWDQEETLAVSDATAKYLTEYPIADWEIEGAFGLVVQFVHDWATGEYSNSAPSNGPIAAFTPSTDHDFDVLDLVIDEGPTFE